MKRIKILFDSHRKPLVDLMAETAPPTSYLEFAWRICPNFYLPKLRWWFLGFHLANMGIEYIPEKNSIEDEGTSRASNNPPADLFYQLLPTSGQPRASLSQAPFAITNYPGPNHLNYRPFDRLHRWDRRPDWRPLWRPLGTLGDPWGPPKTSLPTFGNP